MPTYNVLSEEILEQWRNKLKCLVGELYKDLSYSSFSYFIIEIFEYMQISAYYNLNKDGVENGVIKNPKVSYKSLKSLFSQEEELYIINRFKEVADNLRHTGYNSVEFLEVFIKLILIDKSDICKLVLEKVFPDILEVVNYFSKENIFTVYNELYNEEYQYKRCKYYIQRFCDGKTVIMHDVVNYLKVNTGLSEFFIYNSLFKVLVNADVTIVYK